MKSIASLLAVKQAFGGVTGERSKLLKRSLLQNYLNKVKGTPEGTLACLVLSFQVNEIWTAPLPKFNTMSLVNLDEDIALYFHNGTKTLPYISQHIIYLMSNSSTLGLSTRELSKITFTYSDPYEYMSNLPVKEDNEGMCPLCGVHSKDLCETCKEKLKSHVAFRIQDFVWNVNETNMVPLYVKNYGAFIEDVGSFTAKRIDTYTISFTLNYKGQQMELPFEEYQSKIK